MEDDSPAREEAEQYEGLPKVDDQDLIDLLQSRNDALARATLRLSKASVFAAFGNIP